MLFVDEIGNYKSVSFVGLEKNTGKTTSLNYVLSQLKEEADKFAITSIGVDGESRDRVTMTEKPEIVVPERMVFVTSEKHYLSKRLTSEVLDVTQKETALGRLVTARSVIPGKVLISGPGDTATIRRLINQMENYGVKTTLVDGALSRLSPASPSVTDAMILSTGAALSANIPQLVRQTAFICSLIELPQVESPLKEKLELIDQGLWAIDKDGEVQDLNIRSAFLLAKQEKEIFRYGYRIYSAGVISDKLLDFLRIQKHPVELYIRDFTRVFASEQSFRAFLSSGGTIFSVLKSKLLGVTINPRSPQGFILDSKRLQEELSNAIGLPVYDVVKLVS